MGEVKPKYLKVETRPEEDQSNVQSSSLQDNLKMFWISVTEDEEHIKQIERSFTSTIRSWISYIKNKVRWLKADTLLMRIDLETALNLSNIIKPFIVPSKAIMWFYIKEENVPDGWVICDGKWYSKDGRQSSTSRTNVCTIPTPNLIGKYVLSSIKSEVGNVIEQGLPNITGQLDTISSRTIGSHIGIDDEPITYTPTDDTGAFSSSSEDEQLKTEESMPTSSMGNISFDASKSNPVYGKYDQNSEFKDKVIPPSVKLLPCMKL